jgi:Flp pilus assembly protein TadG
MTGHRRSVLPARLEDGERGSVLLWVLITTPALLMLLMLVVDGGAKMKAAEQADTYAAEAARAATIAIGPRPTGGDIDARAAARAANAYLSSARAAGTVTVTGPTTVRVAVTVSRTGPVSGATFTVTRTATARLLVGVERGESP